MTQDIPAAITPAVFNPSDFVHDPTIMDAVPVGLWDELERRMRLARGHYGAPINWFYTKNMIRSHDPVAWIDFHITRDFLYVNIMNSRMACVYADELGPHLDAAMQEFQATYASKQ